jgi:hypothetical protein
MRFKLIVYFVGFFFFFFWYSAMTRDDPQGASVDRSVYGQSICPGVIMTADKERLKRTSSLAPSLYVLACLKWQRKGGKVTV